MTLGPFQILANRSGITLYHNILKGLFNDDSVPDWSLSIQTKLHPWSVEIRTAGSFRLWIFTVGPLVIGHFNY